MSIITGNVSIEYDVAFGKHSKENEMNETKSICLPSKYLHRIKTGDNWTQQQLIAL